MKKLPWVVLMGLVLLPASGFCGKRGFYISGYGAEEFTFNGAKYQCFKAQMGTVFENGECAVNIKLSCDSFDLVNLNLVSTYHGTKYVGGRKFPDSANSCKVYFDVKKPVSGAGVIKAN